MGFEHIRVSKAGAHAHRLQSRAESTCLTGGFYKTPTSNQKIDALYPLNITWDPSCLTPANDQADIYLYAPGLATPRLHMWSGVTFSSGSYNATLKPRWWNSTASEQLQLLIIQHGDAPFLATLPGGPTFTATYQAPSSGPVPDAADVSKASTDAGITNVDAQPEPASSHRGKIAAAVLLPLLALIALGVFGYLKLSRAKGKEKRRAYAESVDKRMSTISTDWKSMSAAGAQAAIRHSMAVGEANPRASSFSFGAIRPPSSVYPSDGHDYGQAGVGVPEMSQYSRSPGVGLRSSVHSNALAAARVSRVSFAESANSRPRPSGESRRSVYERRSQAGQSRAFHFSGENEPPMPEGAAERASMFVGGINPALVRAGNTNPSLAGLARINTSTTTVNTSRLSRFDEVYGEEDGEDQARLDSMYASYGAYAYSGPEDEAAGAMSPNQRNGPHALSEDDLGPALSMIRTHDQEDGRLPSFPTPVHYEYSQTSPSTSNWTGRDETLFTASPITPGFPTAPLSFAQAMSMSRTASDDSSPSVAPAPIVEPTSPVSGMMAPPVQGMSPDDMLRMYAERRAAGAGSRTTTPSNDVTPPVRALSPSTPGTFSPTRGAYGVSGFDE